MPLQLDIANVACLGIWATTDNSISTVETSPGTLTKVQIVGPTEADPAGWGTKESPVILRWTSLPTATRLWAQVSFQCSLGRNWGWPEPRTMGNNQSMGLLAGSLTPNKTTWWPFLFLEAGVRATVLQFSCYLSGSISAQRTIPH